MTSDRARDDAPSPSPRLTAGLLAALCAVMTLNPIVANTYLPALAIMAEEFGTSIAGIQVGLTAFFAGVAVGQLAVGALSDALGRRRVILAGFVVMTLAGIVVATAPTLEVFIVARVVQGLGASAGVVVVRAIVSDVGVGTQVPRAYSLLTGTMAAGPLLASLGGTVLLLLFGWRAPLLGILAASVIFLVVAWAAVPETLAPARRASLRPARMAGAYGRLLRDPVYVGNALTMAFVFAGLTVHVSASSFVAQEVLGADPWGFWLMFTAYALSVLAGGWLNGPLAARFGPRRMIQIELPIAIATALALTVLAATGVLGIPVYVVLIVIGCACVAGTMANATALTVGRASFAVGSGAALMGCLQFAGGALASPVGGVAGTSTALPMAAGMLAFYLLSLAASAFARRLERGEPRGLPSTENDPAPPPVAGAL